MAFRKSARGSGVNPDNDLARELTKAKQRAKARRKLKKPIEALLHPAKYKPQRVLIKKARGGATKEKKPPHP